MLKLLVVLVLVGGWYLHTNDLTPDLGLSVGWARAATVGRGSAPGDEAEYDRIRRMEADLDAQTRYLDELAARVRAPKAAARPGVDPAGDHHGDVEMLNDGAVRYRHLYETYREDVERYNAHARRTGRPVHRLLPLRTDLGTARRARPVLAAVDR